MSGPEVAVALERLEVLLPGIVNLFKMHAVDGVGAGGDASHLFHMTDRKKEVCNCFKASDFQPTVSCPAFGADEMGSQSLAFSVCVLIHKCLLVCMFVYAGRVHVCLLLCACNLCMEACMSARGCVYLCIDVYAGVRVCVRHHHHHHHHQQQQQPAPPSFPLRSLSLITAFFPGDSPLAVLDRDPAVLHYVCESMTETDAEYGEHPCRGRVECVGPWSRMHGSMKTIRYVVRRLGSEVVHINKCCSRPPSPPPVCFRWIFVRAGE